MVLDVQTKTLIVKIKKPSSDGFFLFIFPSNNFELQIS
jgi:hypothetical protein